MSLFDDASWRKPAGLVQSATAIAAPIEDDFPTEPIQLDTLGLERLHATYSADMIANANYGFSGKVPKVRGVFTWFWKGRPVLLVSTAGMYFPKKSWIGACVVKQVGSNVIQTKKEHGERGDPFYEGIVVSCQGKRYLMTGKKLTFYHGNWDSISFGSIRDEEDEGEDSFDFNEDEEIEQEEDHADEAESVAEG